MDTEQDNKAVIKDQPLEIAWGELTSDFPLHCHDFCELVFITQGSGIHVAEGLKFQLEAGDVFVLKEKQYHAFKVKDQKLTVVNIKYDATHYAHIFHNLDQLAGFNLLFKLEPLYREEYVFDSHLRLNEVQLNHALSIINEISEEYKEQVEGYQTMVDLLFTQLVVYISRSYSQSVQQQDNNMLNMGEVLSYINRHYAETIRLEQLAAKANMSVNHFLRMFKVVTGQSPIGFLLQTRLEKAKEIIRNSSLPISQIAYQCGFQDSNYFSRQFKKHFGISPREFRSGRTK